nr:hypothetical protein [Pseudoalteromonas sp. S2755]
MLVGKANLRTNSWLLEVNSTQLALKLAARKALIIRSSGYLTSPEVNNLTHSIGVNEFIFFEGDVHHFGIGNHSKLI